MMFYDIGRGQLPNPECEFGGGDLTNGSNDRKGNFAVVPTFTVVDTFPRCCMD